MKRGPARQSPFNAANRVHHVTGTVGAETGGNTIVVALQLKDADNADLAERGAIRAYLSTDANGDTIAPTAPSGGVAAGTDGICRNLESGKVFELVSEADGDIDVSIVEASTATWYLNCIMPSGNIVTIGPITFI